MSSEILNILIKGKPDNTETDDYVKESIDILKDDSECNPEYVLKCIESAVEVRIDGMVSLALAILTTNAPDEFFTRNTIGKIATILSCYTPNELLEYAEYIRSKAFGKGLGSRPQKLIRMVMEGWDIVTIKGYGLRYPQSFTSLLRLIHPRYQGSRGKIIAEILK